MTVEPIIRPMRREDFGGVLAIDKAITSSDRATYYERKFRVLGDEDVVDLCLVAEVGGEVVGFVMGDMVTGEFGIPEAVAVLDTIGIHPEYQDKGIATALFKQFRNHLKALHVHTAYTTIEWGDWHLAKFFEKEGFVPSDRVNLELKL